MATLALTLGNIKTRVKRQFGDTAAVQITDNDIMDWANAAIRELIRLNNLNKKRATAATVASQIVYTLPTGIVSLLGVKWQGKTLQILSQEEADQYLPYNDTTVASGKYPVGEPTHYWLYDQDITPQLFLYPAPQNAGDSDLTLYYSQMPPTALAGDTDALDAVGFLPLAYHNRVLDYCLAQAYELDGNTELYDRKMQQFVTGRVDLLGEDTASEPPFYDSITTLPSDFGDYVDYVV